MGLHAEYYFYYYLVIILFLQQFTFILGILGESIETCLRDLLNKIPQLAKTRKVVGWDVGF